MKAINARFYFSSVELFLTLFTAIFILFGAVKLSVAEPPDQSEPPLTSYTVLKATDPITIDGLLDEADWKRVVEAPMNNHRDGSPNPLKTTVRILWDDTNLYVGFYCEDKDAWATYDKKDANLWEEEVVEIFVDPDEYTHFYYEYEYNPLNNFLDLVVMNAGKRLNGKFGGWFAWDHKGMKNAVYLKGDPKHGTNDEYWTVEVALPLDAFWVAANIPPKDGDMWRFNAYRFERKDPKEPKNYWQAAWCPVINGSFHTPWRFGKIYFKE